VSAPEPDLQVIYARNDHARRIIAGCMSAMPVVAKMWEQVDRALADVPAIGAVIARTFSRPCAPRSPRTRTGKPTPCTT
jgi:hypothetical protein